MKGDQWISFLRQYGPIPTKDNLYDENLQRRSRKTGIKQVLFKHPYEDRVQACFDGSGALGSVILTGTAGDGKTFLCGRIWSALKGSPEAWAGQESYLQLPLSLSAAEGREARTLQLHVFRDLSAWVPPQGNAWPSDKLDLMRRFCASMFEPSPAEVFLLAANDGQLAETLRRLPDEDLVERSRRAVEELLVAGREQLEGASLHLFNLSRGSSAELFDLALDALLAHEGWAQCRLEAAVADQLFGDHCPIRRNYELLAEPLVRKRLRSLLELCDQNGLHVPVRQLLILLSNAVLGHKSVKEQLMQAADVPKVISKGERHLASLYSNIFGGNLSESRRNAIAIFEYLERFQIGRETTNRVDNILIFGESHEHLQAQFDRLVRSDPFYGADPAFTAAKQEYIEGGTDGADSSAKFLAMLVAQRQALFFKVSEEDADQIRFWDLTVFRYGGEYLESVLGALANRKAVRRGLMGRLVRGINRIFTGMLLSGEHELLIASSASLSQARVSRFLEAKISVAQQFTGERVEVVLIDRYPVLRVALSREVEADFRLTLTRFEYLSRVAEGAMPSSFSKECFEDVMAFKSQLMRLLQARDQGAQRDDEVTFSTLEVDGSGNAREKRIEVQL